MIAELGHFALILAGFIAVLQAGLTMNGLIARDPAIHGFARAGAMAQFALIVASFACLTWLFAVSDFSVLVVAENSHSAKPFIYKLTGVWGNHEGSMLLWVLILTGYTAVLAWSADRIASRLISWTFAIQSGITAAFIAFLALTSNPFARLWPAPVDGNGLNPLLQDPGLASHPPFLYAGYVGFSITFAFALAALIQGRADARWARIVRPWALAAWSFLTIGIMLGASWAYFELGWGGWWAWDPVENASLMPWLAGTAFIHSLRVMEKRDTLKAWTILLALLTFSLSLVGTFLVRSGIVTSVHAFATDPERGTFILLILYAVIGGSLLVYALRAHVLKPTGTFSTVSRESTLLLNNLFLVVACLLVLVGTFYPVFVDAFTDETVTIGAPFYNATFNTLLWPLLALVPISAMLAWKRGNARRILGQLWPALAAGGVMAVIALWVFNPNDFMGAAGAALAIWIALGVLLDVRARIKLFDLPWKASLARAKNLPLGIWGMIVSHFGLAVLIFGITGVSAWKSETLGYLEPGGQLELGGYSVQLADIRPVTGENYVGERGNFLIRRGQRDVGSVQAEQRFYEVRGMATTESGVLSRLQGDVYVTIGREVAGLGWPVHAYIFPFAVWLWTGGVILALGGILAIADRGRRSLRAPSGKAREA